MLVVATALLCSAAALHAKEHIRGGYVCYPGTGNFLGDYSGCDDVIQRERTMKKIPLDGWYLSAATMLLGSPKACIADPRSLFGFHASGTYRAGGNPWEGVTGYDPVYAAWMNRSPWGKRIYNYVQNAGWNASPAMQFLSGAQLMAPPFSVPACVNGGR